MKYRINPKNNDKLSVLGFGCMRFTKDDNELKKQIKYAIDKGVNYFDTAYIYPNSEARLGKVLNELGCRKDIKISTKLPPQSVKKYEDFDKIFNTQLQRLQTDYIDYYFMHMLTDLAVWERLINLGVLDWIKEKQASGQIKNLGFSYHGGRQEFIKILDSYDFDFCMIQYNYLDENNQASKSGLQYAASKGIPVMIMEPLRGGTLAKLPNDIKNVFPDYHTPVEWALRWVWNHPEVTLLLSGMSTMEMVEENINVASTTKANAFTNDELEVFEKVKKVFASKIKVGCTGCNYCMPCPLGVDIPTCFSCYNNIYMENKLQAIKLYLMQTTIKTKPTNASKCKGCRQCEKHCPQNIDISKELKQVSKALEGFYYKPTKYIIKKFMKL